ncbi:MAG: phage head morphogenesis protein [Burkholderiales bacterium]|nr:MAG: phage head morphogenesis protein [Burkholderiales bacterium]
MDDKKATPPWAKLGALTPQEAYAWFSAKRLVHSFRWSEVWESEHSTAFTVAGMLKEDLLATVHGKLQVAIEEGRDAKWFEEELTPILQQAGWWGRQDIADSDSGEVRSAQLGSPTRLALIYDVNVRQAYAAGRWEQAQRTKATAPYMRYVTMRDERVRKSHAAWDALVLPMDDPFWDTHYPPNGYRCRCIAEPISDDGIQDLKDAGFKVITRRPKITYVEYEKDGQRIKVPAGIDPGFGYNAGKARGQSLADAQTRQRAALPKAIRDAAEKLPAKQARKP